MQDMQVSIIWVQRNVYIRDDETILLSVIDEIIIYLL